ncbi:MAG TPA: hypothetical protein DEO89_05465, partial [Lachnospiraceae bacterium]|nr:hypothetical protein [Lachnospiraceae bacterium]
EEHKTYEEIRKSIDEYLTGREKERITMMENDIAYAEEASGESDMAKYADGSAGEYTRTNVQVEGIDEADIVKTDGKYIYAFYQDAVSSTICIVKAAGKDSSRISQIVLDDVQVQNLYVKDRWLVVLAANENESTEEADCQTNIYLYDVSDAENPVCRSKNSQSGTYSDSRLAGDMLYTISIKQVVNAGKKTDKEEYIPKVNGKLLPEDRLYCPNEGESSQYLVFQSIDLSRSGKVIDSMAVLGAEGTYYMSEKNIYVAAPYTDHGAWQKTKITRYSYDKGTIKYGCEKVINGKILNQFSMDEYEGNLRFAATTYDYSMQSTNGLYILDQSLKTVGSVSRLAPGERIYSARFMGDKVYFVTYRETDPLFLVDVSDPANPVVKDKLKIPGFSDYLHPFGENMLLGIGSIQDKQGNSYVKLSMFDISDPEKVKEIHSKKLEKNSTQNIGNDHKGILVDVQRNRIGFGTQNYDTGISRYEIFSYDTKKGFQNIANLPLEESRSAVSRGLYIGKDFYLCRDSYGICVYDTKKYKKIRSIAY